MTTSARIRSATRWLAAGAGLAGGAYGTFVITTWRRYGRVVPAKSEEKDELLDTPPEFVVARPGLEPNPMVDMIPS